MTATLPAAARGPMAADRPRRRPGMPAALVLALAAGIALRVLSSGQLWLDESLSVAIARLPLGSLLHALHEDGSPPLYYLLLHGWIAAFGTGRYAVRALSSVIALVSLPLAFRAGRRVGGRRLGWVTVLLTASSPYALRYATETRMYALVLALVFLGVPLLLDALVAPRWPRLVGITVLTAALAYTHYWTFYLLGPVAVWLAWRRSWRVLAAMAAAAVLFAPWLGQFWFQLRHTGTPWAAHPGLGVIVSTLLQWGGPGSVGQLLGLSLVPVALAGLFAVAPGRGDGLVSLDLRGRVGMRALAALTVAPLLLAAVLGQFGAGGYAIRYTAVCLPFYLLLLARGVLVLPVRLGRAVLALAVLAGLGGGLHSALEPRTQADEVAAALLASARPGDVVAYCPDQLAPAVHRLLPAAAGLRELAYADPAGPARVDWVDYAQRTKALLPAGFARQALDAAGSHHAVWLVSQDGYRVFEDICPQVQQVLAAERGVPTETVTSRGGIFEHESLLVYPPTS